MNKLNILKSASDLTVSLSVGAIVGNLIAATTPPQAKIITKVFIRVGSLALGTVLGDLAATKVSDQIDEVATSAHAIKQTVKTIKEANKES